MPHRRWSLAALALAPLMALGACDQIGQILERMRGEQTEAPGPAPLEDVPLDARALSGSVQPQDQIAALLAPEPVLIAPGQILVGARVEQQLADTAARMGLASNFVRSLRAGGVEALEQLPSNMIDQVRSRAEAEASAAARTATLDVLGRLGVQGEIEVRPGGMVTIDLAAGASPTALRHAQQGADAAGRPLPATIEWSDADRCPRVVTQGQLERDIALATRCAIQRLSASRQFDYVEPNYVATGEFSRPPREQPPTTTPAPSQPAPTTPAPAPRIGGAPNDPLWALQWHFRNNGQGDGASPGGAGFISFWDAQQVGSPGIRVAVLDTGLDLNHPDIRASANVTSGPRASGS